MFHSFLPLPFSLGGELSVAKMFLGECLRFLEKHSLILP
jgi:hypothetical protein